MPRRRDRSRRRSSAAVYRLIVLSAVLTFLTVLVILHNAALPYSTTGVHSTWAGRLTHDRSRSGRFLTLGYAAGCPLRSAATFVRTLRRHTVHAPILPRRQYEYDIVLFADDQRTKSNLATLFYDNVTVLLIDQNLTTDMGSKRPHPANLA